MFLRFLKEGEYYGQMKQQLKQILKLMTLIRITGSTNKNLVDIFMKDQKNLQGLESVLKMLIRRKVIVFHLMKLNTLSWLKKLLVLKENKVIKNLPKRRLVLILIVFKRKLLHTSCLKICKTNLSIMIQTKIIQYLKLKATNSKQ